MTLDCPTTTNGRKQMRSAAAAEYLGITDNALRKWRMRRYGPRYQKVGGEVRYHLDDLDAWLAAQFIDGSGGGER